MMEQRVSSAYIAESSTKCTPITEPDIVPEHSGRVTHARANVINNPDLAMVKIVTEI